MSATPETDPRQAFLTAPTDRRTVAPDRVATSVSVSPAAAAHVRSEVARVLLPPPTATAPRAATGSETVTHHKLVWKDVGKDALSKTAAEFSKVLPDEMKEFVESYLAPQANKLTIRAPRLFETLPEASLAGYHRHETEAGGYGQLPDPEARLEIVDVAGETRRTVATIAVDHEKMPLAIVGKVALPNKVTLEVHDEPKDILPLGLRGTVTFWAELSEQTGDLAKADADFPAHIDENDDPYAPGVFPKVEPIFGLLPLLLRLSEKEGSDVEHFRLSQYAPLAGPRWLFRPHLEPTGASAPGTEEDLAYALRVIVDLQRLRSMAAAGGALMAALQGGEPAKINAARGLMKSVEEGRTAMVSRLLGEVDSHSITKLLSDALAAKDKGVALFSVVGDMIKEDPVMDDLTFDHRLLLIFGSIAGSEAQLIANYFSDVFFIGEPFNADFNGFDGISNETADLAARSCRSAEPQTPEVFAHHANIPPTKWGQTGA